MLHLWFICSMNVPKCTLFFHYILRERPFNLKGGYVFFSKKIFWFPMLLKKIFWLWWRKKRIIWFRVFVIIHNVIFWKKNSRLAREKKNILTLVLSEIKILNETKNHNPPFKLNGLSLICARINLRGISVSYCSLFS